MSRLVTFEETVLPLEISDLKVEKLTISLSKVMDRFISFFHQLYQLGRSSQLFNEHLLWDIYRSRAMNMKDQICD